MKGSLFYLLCNETLSQIKPDLFFKFFSHVLNSNHNFPSLQSSQTPLTPSLSPRSTALSFPFKKEEAYHEYQQHTE